MTKCQWCRREHDQEKPCWPPHLKERIDTLGHAIDATARLHKENRDLREVIRHCALGKAPEGIRDLFSEVNLLTEAAKAESK